MKIDFTCILILMVSTGSFFSCKKEPIMSYEEAIKNGKMDTMMMIRNGETLYSPHLSLKSILHAQLPSFKAELLSGDTLDNDYFKGKVTVINFWFIGCLPCEEEMPGFNALVEKYKSKPVQFLALSRNSPDQINEFFLKHPFHVDHIALAENITRDIFHQQWAYPLTIVADANGRILYAETGGVGDSTAVQKIQEELIPVIDEALKKM